MNIADVFSRVRSNPLTEAEVIRVRSVIAGGPLSIKDSDKLLIELGLLMRWSGNPDCVTAGPHARHFHGPDGKVAPIFTPKAWRTPPIRA